jgi:orotate phosphoribosyltransferase
MATLDEEALGFYAIPGMVKHSNWLRRSGRPSEFYLDFDVLVADPYRAETVAELYVEKITAFLRQNGPVHFLGFLEKARGGTVGAIVMAVRLSGALQLPMILIRPRKDIPSERVKLPRDERGQGLDLAGRRVLIVTDHCSTGEEAVEAAREVVYSGGEVAEVLAYTAAEDVDRALLEREQVAFDFIVPAGKALEVAGISQPR